MATAQEILDLQTDPEFLARLTVAFSQVAYLAATSPVDPDTKPEQRKGRLEAVKFLVDAGPALAQEELKKSLMLVLGAPAIVANGAKVTDEELVEIAGKLLQTFEAFREAGGTL